MTEYIDPPELLGCETLQAYRLARPHPSRHPFLRALRALIEHRAPESIEHRVCGECDAVIPADSYICPRDPHHYVLNVEYVQRRGVALAGRVWIAKPPNGCPVVVMDERDLAKYRHWTVDGPFVRPVFH